jgi:hypothetical protein
MFLSSISCRYMKSIYHTPYPSFLHHQHPTHNPLYTLNLFYSPDFLLIFKLMFKGVSQCMPAVGVLYFGPFNPFHYSPLPLYLPSPIFQQLSTHILISSTITSSGMWYYWCSIVLFSFPSFSEFYWVVPLLQTCSTFVFAYDHACSCVYVYLWIYFPCMRENMQLLCFWS